MSAYGNVKIGTELSAVKALMRGYIVFDDISQDIGGRNELVVCGDDSYLMIFMFEDEKLTRKKLIDRRK
jgi:hypothetical protein